MGTACAAACLSRASGGSKRIAEIAKRGDESSVLDQEQAARWLLIRELLMVARLLPPGVTVAIAKGIATDDFEDARSTIGLACTLPGSWQSTVVPALSQHAPILAGMLLPAVYPERPTGPPQGISGVRIAIHFRLGMSVLGQIIRIARQDPRAVPPPPAASESSSNLEQGRPRDQSVIVQAQQLAERCRYAGHDDLSRAAQRLAKQAAAHRCESIRAQRDDVLRELRQLDAMWQANYAQAYLALDADVTAACPPSRIQAEELEGRRRR